MRSHIRLAVAHRATVELCPRAKPPFPQNCANECSEFPTVDTAHSECRSSEDRGSFVRRDAQQGDGHPFRHRMLAFFATDAAKKILKNSGLVLNDGTKSNGKNTQNRR